MAVLTDPEIAEFLSIGDRNGKLSYLRADRRPMIVPIWFVPDEGEIVFFTKRASHKAKAFIEDPRVAFAVDEGQWPYGYVTVNGVVAESSDPKDVEELLPKIVARYTPADLFEQTLALFKDPGEAVYRIRPTAVSARLNVMNSQIS